MQLKYKSINIKGKLAKQLLRNFVSLSIVQGLEMILPLLTVPYLIRIIGVENVGLLAFVSAVIGYFGIFINYGFNLTATKEISQNVDDKEVIESIFNAVFTAKNYLILLSAIMLILLILMIPAVEKNAHVYLLSFGTIVLLNISPTWYFQGIQKLKFITISNIISKFFFTIMIFVFVREENDFWIVPAITFIGAFVTSVLSLIYVVRVHKIRIKKTSFISVLKQYDSGKFVFLSQVKITFFSNINVLILGLILGNTAVGLFSSADKVIKVMSALQVPIVSALFPYFSKLFREDYKVAFNYIKKIAVLGTVVYIVIIIVIFILSNFISSFLFGKALPEIAVLIRIMCTIPLFVFLNNLYGTQTLLNLNRDKTFLYNIIGAAAINSFLIYPLGKFFGVYGVSFSLLITEFYLFVSMYISSVKVKKKLLYD
ncbi:oligosaccharide flippase family protein [Flavobacterium sp. RS13.1]|uniref:oligosaccharide flippase family protein n=1 Tax=Flavobacterium sp. RS13.1 TaxID=3400345 RepID=UPI003AAA9CEB